MKLYIKNMVCSRCKMVVRMQLEKLELHPHSVQLGEVDIAEENISDEQKSLLNEKLNRYGFELIDDKKSRMNEKIKNEIVALVHYSEEQLKINFSEHISRKLHHDYTYLSNMFSEIEGTSIEKYFINQKIEKVKELLMYNELSLSEIAFKLNYSSIAHLSNQFKKITGFTPSYFKNMKDRTRTEIETI